MCYPVCSALKCVHHTGSNGFPCPPLPFPKVQCGEDWFCPKKLPEALLHPLRRPQAGRFCCDNPSQKKAHRNQLIAHTVGSYRPSASLSLTLVLLVAQTQGCDLSSEASCPLHGCPLLGPSSSAPGFLQPCDRGPTFQDDPHPHLAPFVSSRDHPHSALSTALHPSFYSHPIHVSYLLPAIHSSEQLTQLPHRSTPAFLAPAHSPALGSPPGQTRHTAGEKVSVLLLLPPLTLYSLHGTGKSCCIKTS